MYGETTFSRSESTEVNGLLEIQVNELAGNNIVNIKTEFDPVEIQNEAADSAFGNEMYPCHGCKILRMEIDSINKKLESSINILNNLVKAQTKTVLMLTELSKQKGKTFWTFPIKDVKQLYEVEKEIGEKRDEYTAAISQLLFGSLSKSLTSLVDTSVLMQFNYEGTQQKKPFRDLVNLNNVIFQCLSKEGYTHAEYKKDMQLALRRIKNRYFKDIGRRRKQKLS